MDENIETEETYTNKEFAKDVVKSVVVAVAEVAAAHAALLAIGFVYVKVQDRKARRAAQNNPEESN